MNDLPDPPPATTRTTVPDRTPVRIMAVLNVTPDSFSDGGRLGSSAAVLQAAEEALEAGADILDVGGESTRPGSRAVAVAEEIERIGPVIRDLHRRFPRTVISIDTRKATVAQVALDAGASIINDVSGLQYDAAMASLAARYDVELILMHSRGEPETMQWDPQYPEGVLKNVYEFFKRQMTLAIDAGVRRERIILDPGFGFGKTRAHNLTLLAHLDAFHGLGRPLLAGLSRKSFLSPPADSGSLSPVPVSRRESLTAAAVALAVEKGACYIRVHDVPTQAPVIRLAEAVRQASCEADGRT